MISHRIKKKRSFFLSILGLFLILSVFIIFISALLFINRTKKVIYQEFSEKNLAAVSQVSHMFDVLHSQLIPGLKEASYNNHTIFRLMYGDDLTVREMLDGMTILDNLIISYPLVNSLYIYNGQMNYFLSTISGLVDAEDFADKEVLSIVRKFDHNLIDRYWPRTAILWNSLTQKMENRPVLTLLMGTTPEHEAPLKGALISNIDVEELQKLLNTRYGQNHDEIIIVNHQGELICRSRNDSQEDSDQLFSMVEQLQPDRGMLAVEGDKLIAYQFNLRLGWYFISVMPLEPINKNIYEVSRNILWIMTCLLMVSIFLSYWATRRIYKPIDSLMHAMADSQPSEKNVSLDADSRELSFILHRYRDILTEKASLEDSLEDLQDDYRLEILRSILEGHEYHFWGEELQSADMELLKNPFCLYVIQIDNYYKISQEMKAKAFQNLRRSLVTGILNFIETKGAVLVDMDVRNLVCIFPGTPQKSSGMMKGLQEKVRNELPFTISISRAYRQNLEEIRLNTLYNRALCAVGGKFAGGFDQFIPYTNQDASTIIFPGELADRLLQHMRQGDLPGALNKLEELGAILRDGTYQDFLQHIRIFSYRLLRYLKEQEAADIKKLLQHVRSYPETLETLRNYRTFFRDILESIHRQTNQPGKKGMTHFLLIGETLKEQYRDPACCVQSLADQLNISPNYLRQIYKSFSGDSLSDAIVRMRVEEACRLLIETGDAVKKLYSSAGFSNYNSFFSCFKKYTGRTPAEYRRNSSKA